MQGRQSPFEGTLNSQKTYRLTNRPSRPQVPKPSTGTHPPKENTYHRHRNLSPTHTSTGQRSTSQYTLNTNTQTRNYSSSRPSTLQSSPLPNQSNPRAPLTTYTRRNLTYTRPKLTTLPTPYTLQRHRRAHSPSQRTLTKNQKDQDANLQRNTVNTKNETTHIHNRLNTLSPTPRGRTTQSSKYPIRPTKPLPTPSPITPLRQTTNPSQRRPTNPCPSLRISMQVPTATTRRSTLNRNRQRRPRHQVYEQQLSPSLKNVIRLRQRTPHRRPPTHTLLPQQFPHHQRNATKPRTSPTEKQNRPTKPTPTNQARGPTHRLRQPTLLSGTPHHHHSNSPHPYQLNKRRPNKST